MRPSTSSADIFLVLLLLIRLVGLVVVADLFAKKKQGYNGTPVF